MRRSEIIETKYRHMAPASLSAILTCFLYHKVCMVNIHGEV